MEGISNTCQAHHRATETAARINVSEREETNVRRASNTGPEQRVSVVVSHLNEVSEQFVGFGVGLLHLLELVPQPHTVSLQTTREDIWCQTCFYCCFSGERHYRLFRL